MLPATCKQRSEGRANDVRRRDTGDGRRRRGASEGRRQRGIGDVRRRRDLAAATQRGGSDGAESGVGMRRCGRACSVGGGKCVPQGVRLGGRWKLPSRALRDYGEADASSVEASSVAAPRSESTDWESLPGAKLIRRGSKQRCVAGVRQGRRGGRERLATDARRAGRAVASGLWAGRAARSAGRE